MTMDGLFGWPPNSSNPNVPNFVSIYINFPMIVSRHPFAAGEDAMASSSQWPN
jgi:hypothetical protein